MNRTQISRDIFETDSIWFYNHVGQKTTENMTTMGKVDASD